MEKRSKALRLAKQQKGGGKTMKEKIVKMEKGPKFKKYTAYVKNNKTKKIRKIHFGDNRYEQFKDRTKLGLYSSIIMMIKEDSIIIIIDILVNQIEKKQLH